MKTGYRLVQTMVCSYHKALFVIIQRFSVLQKIADRVDVFMHLFAGVRVCWPTGLLV